MHSERIHNAPSLKATRLSPWQNLCSLSPLSLLGKLSAFGKYLISLFGRLVAFTKDRKKMYEQQPRDDRPSNHGYWRDDNTHDQAKGQRRDPPPGWLDCPAFGQEILGCLIPSKVPLAESFFDDNILPDKRYSFRQAIDQQKILGRTIGLVIDLTNSTRYYNLNELREQGIKHVKIRCRGRDSMPENEAVNKFVHEVSKFQKQQPARKCILVHCTHGHNRTGYMIVHYLMRTMQPSVSITQAIKIFADARPPGIYKPAYINALYNFYHEERPPGMVVCPPTPEWKLRSEPDLHFNGDDHDNGDSAKSHEAVDELVVMTNEEIIGDKIPRDQEMAMRQFCYQTLKLRPGGPRQHFPGSHPVSLNRYNLQLLRRCYYYATWKADGTRYMMLISIDGCYLIDRQFTFWRVQMRFPCRPHANEEKTHHHCRRHHHHFTLLDGEMVIDTLPNSPKQERRYLVYDMMAINQDSIVDLPFHERWRLIEEEVIEPRNFERENIHQSQNPYYRYDLEPFRVRRKEFWPLPRVTNVLKDFIPNLSHAADGLIFQGRDDPYVPRTHEGLLKWKYGSMNSVDFLFEVVDNQQSLYLFERGRKKLLMTDNRPIVVFPEELDPTACSGKIIECSWNPNEKSWVFMRVRTDKGSPNGFITYKKVMASIKDNITEDILLNEIDKIIALPLYTNVRTKD